MAINTVKKGKRNEAKARKFYEEHGYDVEVVRYEKFRKVKDYFGLWDLICVGKKDIRFVQVKTNQKPTKKWIEDATEWGPDSDSVKKEYVVYKDYQRGVKPSIRKRL